MYRLRRRRKLQRRRRATVVTAAIAVLALAIGVPTLAAANGVDTLLNGIGVGGGGGDVSGGDTASPTPEAGLPPDYVPPLHGTNPHGQGTGAVVDLAPSDTNPLPPFPDTGEDIIVGDSDSDQNEDGTYHGRVTAAWLFGITLPDLLQIESNPGESKDGALEPLNEALGPNGALCTAQALCLTVLDMHTEASDTGSSSSFSAADVSALGLVGAGAVSSEGDISHDPATGCQTSHGSSQVLGANALGGLIGADTLPGESTSTACPDGTQTVSQSSGVLGLTGLPGFLNVPIASEGCENGTPNTQPDLLGLADVLATIGVLSASCNANDENAGQTSSPYGVREGLTAFLLPVAGGLAKVTTAGPESHAVAQAAPTTPATPVQPATPPAGQGPGNGNKGNKGNGNNGNGGNGAGGAGAAAGAAAAGNGQLAFTGADLLVLGLVGGALILGGLALTTTAGRRHRRTV